MATTAAHQAAQLTELIDRFTMIPATHLRDGMIGAAGEVRNVRESQLGGDPTIAWTDSLGRIFHAWKDSGWVTVTKASVTHRVRIRQVPEPLVGGCPTGNYAITAVCVGCGWESDSTSSGCMANAWSAEHELSASAVSR